MKAPYIFAFFPLHSSQLQNFHELTKTFSPISLLIEIYFGTGFKLYPFCFSFSLNVKSQKHFWTNIDIVNQSYLPRHPRSLQTFSLQSISGRWFIKIFLWNNSSIKNL